MSSQPDLSLPDSDSEQPSKYAVLRWSDWMAFRKALTGVADGLLVDDAVVLRLQDVTVAPLLHTYASILQSFIETVPLDDEQVGTLRHIADYMHSQAVAAENLPYRKLPD